jgi:tetratricopeptide (TPR) repeat protein
LLLTSGAIQLGFGYVESYPLLHLLVLCYLGFGWVALDAAMTGQRHLTRRALLLHSLIVLAISAHLSAIALLPAHAYLMARMARSSGVWRTGMMQFPGAIAAIGLMLIAGATGAAIRIERMAIDSAVLPWRGPYSLLSPAHVLDFVNEMALVIPAFLPLALANARPSRFLGDARHAFLALAVLGTAGLAFAINPLLGMARDWDLVSLFWLPSTMLLVAGMVRARAVNVRSSMAIVATACLCAAPWILVNHDVDAASARFLHLLAMDRNRPGTAYGYEILATQLRYRGQHQDAVLALESALELRASSKRLQGQLAHAKLLLARDHVRHHRLVEALSVLGTVASDDRSVRAERHFLAGIALLEQGQATPALAELEQAVRSGWTGENVIFHLGYAFRKCGRHEEASQMFRDYLRRYPSGPYANSARRFLSDEDTGD